MQPVLGRNAAIAEVLAHQDVLPHKRDHHGVFDIMIEGIAAGDAFEAHAPGPAEDTGVVWLKLAVGQLVGLLQTFHKGID